MTRPAAVAGHITLPATATRALLWGGAVAGPLVLGVVGAQVVAHDTFDPRLHPLSSLSLGSYGWIQISNFIVVGLLVLGFATGLGRVLREGPGRTAGPVLVGLNGVSLIVAGLFLADPVNGYPEGMADAVTAHGVVHSIAPSIAGLTGLAGYIVFARRFARLRQRGLTVLCIVVGPVELALNAAAVAMGDFRVMLLAAGVGWGWNSLIAIHLLRNP
jgi:hypothetical protein